MPANVLFKMRDRFLAPEERTLAALSDLDIPGAAPVKKPVQDLSTNFMRQFTHRLLIPDKFETWSL